MGGTLAVTGVATLTARSVHNGGITIADGGQIGSTSDADAIAIAANGVLTAVEYYNIEIINDVIYYSVSISVMYSDVTQNESGYEVYTAHYGDSGEIVFVPANFPN